MKRVPDPCTLPLVPLALAAALFASPARAEGDPLQPRLPRDEGARATPTESGSGEAVADHGPVLGFTVGLDDAADLSPVAVGFVAGARFHPRFALVAVGVLSPLSWQGNSIADSGPPSYVPVFYLYGGPRIALASRPDLRIDLHLVAGITNRLMIVSYHPPSLGIRADLRILFGARPEGAAGPRLWAEIQPSLSPAKDGSGSAPPAVPQWEVMAGVEWEAPLDRGRFLSWDVLGGVFGGDGFHPTPTLQTVLTVTWDPARPGVSGPAE